MPEFGRASSRRRPIVGHDGTSCWTAPSMSAFRRREEAQRDLQMACWNPGWPSSTKLTSGLDIDALKVGRTASTIARARTARSWSSPTISGSIDIQPDVSCTLAADKVRSSQTGPALALELEAGGLRTRSEQAGRAPEVRPIRTCRAGPGEALAAANFRAMAAPGTARRPRRAASRAAAASPRRGNGNTTIARWRHGMPLAGALPATAFHRKRRTRPTRSPVPDLRRRRSRRHAHPGALPILAG